jgi:omega-6 fatty acid desaturase (delta-12 desaturase)
LKRSGKALLIATREFNEKSRSKSWWYVGTTLFLLVASLFMAALAPWWQMRLVGSILGGLIMARAFILYHDFMHGSILKGSRPAQLLLYALGLVMLVPPRSWRESHNYHHANVAKLGIPAVGSYPILTTAEWLKASRAQRLVYRWSRHPLTILSAYLSIFALTITIAPLLKNPRKNWDSALSLLVHGGALVGLWLIGGPALPFFVLLLPFAIASALGAYLFYAQHTFPGIKMLRADEWTYYRAALESSSYLKTGPVMGWFLGNIGYHHVHHLNRLIPFYRLPEAMTAIPELQNPTVTSLHPREILACLRLNLWDEQTSRMISYSEVGQPVPTIAQRTKEMNGTRTNI